MIAEMAAYYKTVHKKSLIDQLETLYRQYQYFKEDMVSLTEPGEAGMQAIQQRMTDLREDSPKMLGGQPVVKLHDYKSQPGTEPKIKFYFSVCESIAPEQSLEEVDKILKNRIAALKKDLGLL